MANAQQPLIPDTSHSGPSDGVTSCDSDSPNAVKKFVTPEERAIVSRCLEVVEARGKELERKGLTKVNFIFGVANSLFVAWSFGAIPEHFWIVYICEVFILFPLRWRNQVTATPLKQHFFWLDFCWVSNFLSVGAMITLVVHSLAFPDDDAASISVGLRRRVFAASWGIGCGPLLLATGLLGNALVFHDADNTASVLIHLFPSMVLYVMGWQADLVHEAWPSIFILSYFKGLHPWNDIFVNAAMVYTIWLLLYTAWLLVHGMGLPSKGHDTIFHANMRGGFGPKIAKAFKTPQEDFKLMVSNNSFPVSYALLYMFGHALAVYVAICFSLLVFWNKYIHCGACGVMVFVTVYNGASRYTFYIVQSYGVILRKELGIPFHRKGSALETWNEPTRPVAGAP